MKKSNLKSLSLNKKSVSNLLSAVGGNRGVSHYTEGCTGPCNALSITCLTGNVTNCFTVYQCPTGGYTCYCNR